MRVGLDARTLAVTERTGVEQYVVNLVRALAQLQDAPEIIAYTDRPIPDPELSRIAASGPLRLCVVRATFGWLRLALPLEMRRDRIDVAHFPSTIVPHFLLPCPAVVTVHDLAWRRYPEAYSPDDLRMQEVAMASAARAARVIAVSQTTARDLEGSPVPTERVTVIPLGVSPQFSGEGPRLRPDAFPGAERVQDGYLLYVGRLQARKNLLRVLEAYHQMRRAISSAPPLVLVGGGDGYAQQVGRRTEELGLEPHVLRLGHVPDSLLPALYRSATIFLYLSLYEGFGMPVLEAMASGTPVITSNVGGTAEVAGDAALVVNPERVEDMADAMLLLLHDAEVRASFRERGLSRVRHFTWERTARETVGVYQQVASGA